jgi:hypothetical protein
MSWGFVGAGIAVASTAANVIQSAQAQKKADNTSPLQGGGGGDGGAGVISGVSDAASMGTAALGANKSKPLTDK